MKTLIVNAFGGPCCGKTTACWEIAAELKKRGVDLREAFNQIERYQRDSFWAGSGLYNFVQIFGMTLTESMAKLHDWLMDNWEAVEYDVLERIEFTVKGIKGRFKIDMCANHYIFVEGCGDEKDFLEWCRVA